MWIEECGQRPQVKNEFGGRFTYGDDGEGGQKKPSSLQDRTEDVEVGGGGGGGVLVARTKEDCFEELTVGLLC